ncbi:hypothetical protein CGRA01v4_13594 [Colletotrichum graminicola]|nr:hypothetical protein CGRA01v4_13594 [Colletotrichum graminicola]
MKDIRGNGLTESSNVQGKRRKSAVIEDGLVFLFVVGSSPTAADGMPWSRTSRTTDIC